VRRLGFAGSTVEIAWQGLPAAALVDFLFQAVAEACQDAAQPPGPVPALRLESDTAQGRLRLVETAADAASRTWRGPPGRMAVQMMERATYHLADRSCAGALFHAAGLALEGKALALPGNSGVGKSSLALHLAGQGLCYLSDELLCLPAGSGDCAGLARPLHLKSGARGLFPQLPAGALLAVEPAGEAAGGALLAPGQLPGGAARGPAALAAFVFPQYQAGAAFHLRALSKGETAVRLAGVLINARNLPENGFPELLRIARAVPAYEIGYSSFAQIGDTLLDLLR
jgi:hypothetical protein